MSHGNAKLTAEQCHEIRRIYAAGTGSTTLASRYGVSPNTISQVLKGGHSAIKGKGLPSIVRKPFSSPYSRSSNPWVRL